MLKQQRWTKLRIRFIETVQFGYFLVMYLEVISVTTAVDLPVK